MRTLFSWSKNYWLQLFQVDHFFRHRMNNSAVHSLNYLKQFPTPLVSIVAKFVSFVSGGLAGALIIIGFVGESILEGHVSPMFWTVALAKLQVPLYKSRSADTFLQVKYLRLLKKTQPARGKTAPGHFAKKNWRRPSHAGRQNPPNPRPPLHSGTVACVRRPMTWARP